MLIGQIGADASFDDPVSMLLACHDKVRHFARLAHRLGEHIADRVIERPAELGVGADAAQAGASILRYFDLAAPLHHDDEELDLFPALRALDRIPLTHALDALQAEHATLASLWLSIHPWLEATVRGEFFPLPTTLADFAVGYVQHANREEREVYGAARDLSGKVLANIGRNMSARRGAL